MTDGDDAAQKTEQGPAERAALGGANADIADAVEGYERFRERFEKDRDFFQSLSQKKQRPRLLWIGCADSRVVPSEITSADPGELFEIRNIANVVPPAGAADVSVGAAIEYALLHLGIDDIVVCGHTGCGGIEALSRSGTEAGSGDAHLGRWVDYTRPAHALIQASAVPEALRHLETVKAHIEFQLDNLKTYPAVREGLDEGWLGLHGWLYDLEDAVLKAYDEKSGEWRELSSLPGS
ncbi:MAG: carbonic anhydrase [Hyphomicrobium sp.]